MSISAWVRAEENQPHFWPRIIDKYIHWLSGYTLIITETYRRARADIRGLSSEYYYTDGLKALNDNKWHHVMAVLDKGIYTLYVDGVFNTSIKVPSTIKPCSKLLTIGNGFDGYNDYPLRGVIDEPVVSGTGRSLRWIGLSYENQREGSTMVDQLRSTGVPLILGSTDADTVFPGDTARFEIVCEGTGPIVYSFYHNDNLISSTTEPMLEIRDVAFEDLGEYVCIAQNVLGSDTSGPMFLKRDNHAPVFVSTPLLSATEGSAYSYSVIAQDADNDPLFFSLGGFPTGMSIDPISGNVTWIPSGTQSGSHPVGIFVVDSAGDSSRQDFFIEVQEAINTTPRITSQPVISATEGVVYIYQVNAVDDDHDVLSFTLSTFPPGVQIGTQTGLITWTPSGTQAGDHPVALEASDGRGGIAVQQFTINVAEALNNDPSIVSSPLKESTEGSPYEYQVSAIDGDNDVLVYSLSVAPSGMVINDQNGIIQWTPGGAQAGTHNVTIVVSDSRGGTASQSFIITVAEFINTDPVISSTPVLNTIEGEYYEYAVIAEDPDGDQLTYKLTINPDGMVIDTNSGIVSWTPNGSQVGQHEVSLLVTDGRGGEAIQEFNVSVATGINIAPRFVSTPATEATMGEEYIYELSIVDDDGDAVNITMPTAPTGVSINQQLVVSWTPRRTQIGSNEFIIRLDDGAGGITEQPFTVIVAEGPNHPPVFVSSPQTDALEGIVWSYQLDLSDADGDPMQFMLFIAPYGFAVNGNEISFTPQNNQIGAHEVKILAADPYDTVSQNFTINVINVNDTPVITSQPLTQVVPGVEYLYALCAMDPDGDPLSFSLTEYPAGMSISPSGSISWPDEGNRLNGAQVTVTVTDDSDAVTSQSWTIKIVPDTTTPNVMIIAQPNPAYPGENVDIRVIAQDNAAVSATSLFIDGAAVTLDEENRYVLATTVEDTFELTAHVADVNGNTDSAISFVFVNTSADNTPPEVVVTFTPAEPNVGDQVAFTVTATDQALDPERVWLLVDGQYITLDEQGNGAWHALKRGTYTASATAYDSAGNCGAASLPITVAITGSDIIPPTVDIDLSLADTVVFGRIEINGTADDENFAYYTLSYRTKSNNEYVEYFRNTTPVQDGMLGYIDGTALDNGDYVIRLSVFDRYGNASSSEINVRVDGQMKIGLFSLAFTDMQVQLPGMGLSAVRTYDSRHKWKGDFGFGWRLDFNSMTLSETRIIGTEWKRTFIPGQGVPYYEIEPTASHAISITIPGGRTQVFDAVAEYHSPFSPSSGTIQYVGQPGTYSTLEPLDASMDFIVMGGELYDAAGEFIEPYNPNRYRLTLADGTSYTYDEESGGVTEIIDVNGNSIEIKHSGIHHSSGSSLSIVRDGEGRVVALSDGDGRVVSYSYDLHGNLAKVIDPMGNITRFKYGPNHYLIEIIDPRGVRATRTEYDDAGRMVRQISPAGDTMYFDHDIDNRTEITKDFNGNGTEYTYDNHGNVLTKTDATGATWEYTYDGHDNLLSTFNPDNTTRLSTWDNEGNELTTTDERNHTTTRTYNSRGQVLTETDARNRTTTHSYDSRGNLLQTIGPDGTITQVKTYAADGNVLTEKDGEGNLTQYTYDAKGRMISRIDPLGRETHYVLDGRGNTIAEIDPGGDTTRYVYDLNDNQIMTVNAIGDTTRSFYNVFNKIARQVDALGNETTFEYDLFGQLKKTIAADSSFNQRTYDAQGNVKTTTDEVQRTTTFEYDHENRVVKTIFNDGTSIRVEYDALGRRRANVDRNGNRTEYEYDEAGNNTLVRDALDNETSYEYDEINRRTAMVDALGQRTEYTYDAYDRLVRTDFNDGTFSTIEYDDAGRKTAEVDQEGKRTEFTYDSTGNLRTVKDAMLHVTEYTYDKNNNRITQTDANNHTTAMDYDRMNRLISREYPNGDRETFAYDANGNMKSKMDGEGDSTVYTYDSRNREKLRRYTSSGHTVRTVYTVDSKRDSVIDHRGVTTYEWGNCCGQLVRVDNPDGTWLQYEYDDNTNKTAMITPWSRTEYWYDPLNRMDSVIAQNGDVTEYFYNAVGNRDSIAHANGTSVKYTYDNLNRLTNVTNSALDGSVISSYTYELNGAGIRTAVTEACGSRVEYGYDDLYRLTSETRTGSDAYNISYTYDNVGNRITKDDGVVTTYNYNNRDQLESESNVTGSTTYTYDNDGRMITKTDATGTTTYTWQDEDRMVSVTTAAGTINYIYDTDNARVAVDNGSTVKNYLIDKQQQYAQVVAEYDDPAALTVEYVFGLERIVQDRGGSVVTYIADGQGSIRQLTSSTGNVTDNYSYFAFGEELSSSGSTENEFRYVGEQWDANAGWYYNRARWYSPNIGRFTSVDPWRGSLKSPITLHSYHYSRNNPISFSDPSGNNYTLVGLMVAVGVSNILAAHVTPTYSCVGRKGKIDCSCYKEPFKDKVEEIKSAIEDVEGKITTDCIKSEGLKNGLNREFKSMKVKCDPKRKNCGRGVPIIGSTISIGMKSFEMGCGPLASTILHELVHLSQFIEFNYEKVPEACEKSCYGYDPDNDAYADNCK